MKIAQPGGYRCYVELGLFFLEPSGLSQMCVQLTSTNELHDEEDLVLRLEDIFHSHQEWVMCFHENLLLKEGALQQVVVEKLIFSESLHSIIYWRSFLLDQEYFSKGTFSNCLDNIEISKTDLLIISFFGVDGEGTLFSGHVFHLINELICSASI
jgi:hypothetical protein